MRRFETEGAGMRRGGGQGGLPRSPGEGGPVGGRWGGVGKEEGGALGQHDQKSTEITNCQTRFLKHGTTGITNCHSNLITDFVPEFFKVFESMFDSPIK